MLNSRDTGNDRRTEKMELLSVVAEVIRDLLIFVAALMTLLIVLVAAQESSQFPQGGVDSA